MLLSSVLESPLDPPQPTRRTAAKTIKAPINHATGARRGFLALCFWFIVSFLSELWA
ncbi:MAG TPA: hypothetical protein VIM28_04230 [Solirubrobacterales bacterium]